MALLLVERNGSASTVMLDEVTTLGRSPRACIAIDDPRVSRFHARIIRIDRERYLFVDLDSLNGSYLDGQRVAHAELCDGSQIVIGDVSLIFVADDDAAGDAAARGAAREREPRERIYSPEEPTRSPRSPDVSWPGQSSRRRRQTASGRRNTLPYGQPTARTRPTTPGD